MAGIYVHIPFCKQACSYCDFHFSTSLKYKDDIINAIIKELIARKNEFELIEVNTIYFGGGTPSLLSAIELGKVFETINQHYKVHSLAEITLEANPDDINNSLMNEYTKLPINRWSVGVQSFFDEDLAWMNRAHRAKHSEYCIKLLQDKGYNNLSLDLIYGYELLTLKKWKENISLFHELEVPHLSAYSLTIEPSTLLWHQLKKGMINVPDDQKSNEQFLYLRNYMEAIGFDAYEISNYCKPGHRSQHNSSYWKHEPYIGIGPSAHSYKGTLRRWNVSNNYEYLNGIINQTNYFETETLTEKNIYNEQLMIGLRTKEGFSIKFVPEDHLPSFNTTWKEIEQKNWGISNNEYRVLTLEGLLMTDSIVQKLML